METFYYFDRNFSGHVYFLVFSRRVYLGAIRLFSIVSELE